MAQLTQRTGAPNEQEIAPVHLPFREDVSAETLRDAGCCSWATGNGRGTLLWCRRPRGKGLVTHAVTSSSPREAPEVTDRIVRATWRSRRLPLHLVRHGIRQSALGEAWNSLEKGQLALGIGLAERMLPRGRSTAA